MVREDDWERNIREEPGPLWRQLLKPEEMLHIANHLPVFSRKAVKPRVLVLKCVSVKVPSISEETTSNSQQLNV